MGGLVAVAIPATIIGGIAAGGVAVWNIFFKWVWKLYISIKNILFSIILIY